VPAENEAVDVPQPKTARTFLQVKLFLLLFFLVLLLLIRYYFLEFLRVCLEHVLRILNWFLQSYDKLHIIFRQLQARIKR
jgi:hypothetical protein